MLCICKCDKFSKTRMFISVYISFSLPVGILFSSGFSMVDVMLFEIARLVTCNTLIRKTYSISKFGILYR